MTTLTIPLEKYLVFTGKGELPGVVIQQREPSRVEIYIAVK